MTFYGRPTRAYLEQLLQDASRSESRLREMESEQEALGVENSVDPIYLAEVARAQNLASLIDDVTEDLGIDEPKSKQRSRSTPSDDDVIKLLRGY